MAAAITGASAAVDCTDAYQVLIAQMDDMQTGSTKVAFQLASPGNRASTASPGGCNEDKFARMVRSPTYAPLLAGFGYEVERHGKRSSSEYAADVRVFHNKGKSKSTVFTFVMSL